MDTTEVLLVVIAVVLAVSVVSVFSFVFGTPSQAGECSLSLCDCKCYPKGQTPEELTGKICGINCLGEFNVTGCSYVNGMCEVEKRGECLSDSECPEGYVCYNSRLCSMTPTGVVCGEQQGDLLCHKECENDQDCDSGSTCKEITIWTGDAGSIVSVCFSNECEEDSDCVPGECCHPSFCVSKQFKPDCTGIVCTTHCEPGTMDCGQGRCACLNNQCTVIWSGKT